MFVTMRCYYAECPYKGEYRWIYCPKDGVWKGDAVHESSVSCPKCRTNHCKFV